LEIEVKECEFVVEFPSVRELLDGV